MSVITDGQLKPLKPQTPIFLLEETAKLRDRVDQLEWQVDCALREIEELRRAADRG